MAVAPDRGALLEHAAWSLALCLRHAAPGCRGPAMQRLGLFNEVRLMSWKYFLLAPHQVPAIANSAMMFHFAELDAASRMISKCDD